MRTRIHPAALCFAVLAFFAALLAPAQAHAQNKDGKLKS